MKRSLKHLMGRLRYEIESSEMDKGRDSIELLLPESKDILKQLIRLETLLKRREDLK